MGSASGLSDEQLLAVVGGPGPDLFTPEELVALEYADAITDSDADVDDALFRRLGGHFSTDAIVELTAVIAWENASSKFNRALRIDAQNLWARPSDR